MKSGFRSWKARPLCRFQLSCYFSLISSSSRRNLWKCSRFPTSHSQEPKFLCGQKWPSAGRRNVELTMGFWPKMSFINFWLQKGAPYPKFEGVFIEIHFEAKPLSAKKLPYQDVRSRASHHSFWPKMPFISFWLKKKGTPYPFFEGVFIEIHFEAKPLSAKKLPYQDVRSRASHHPFWPKMPFINFWLKKRVPPIQNLRVFSLKFILKQNHWVQRSSHIRMFVQELRITHSDQKCLSLASGWKKRVPPIHFLRVFSLKFILKQNHWVPRSSHIRMFVQELRITHSDQKCLSLTSGWKKGYPLSKIWGCFHWNSFWSKTIECQEAPISGCSFKSFASPILTKNAFH